MNQASAIMKVWREDPVQFVRDNFHVEPDRWQKKVLRAFPVNQRIAMKACKGPGKTCVLAWLIWNFLATRLDAHVVATSVSEPNLRDCLWSELAKWQDKSELLKRMFKWGKTRIESRTRPNKWWCSARTWQAKADRTKQSATLSGFHSEYLLFVLDECATIPEAVMATAEAALATGTETKIVMAGNPELVSGPLYDACVKEADIWYVVEITGDPDSPDRSPRISIEWAKQQIKKYGRDNAFVMVNVLGQFPKCSLTTLFSPDLISECMNRHYDKDKFRHVQKRMGIDAARYGMDDNILAVRQGLIIDPLVEMKNASGPEIASRALFIGDEGGVEVYYIDCTGGYGATVEDSAITLGMNAVPIHFNGGANDEQYYNKRAEMYWEFAEWAKRGGHMPDDSILRKELPQIRYTFHGDKIQLESKEQIKTRLGFSPDRSDGCALTFADPDVPSQYSQEGSGRFKKRNRDQVLHEYDPFAEKN